MAASQANTLDLTRISQDVLASIDMSKLIDAVAACLSRIVESNDRVASSSNLTRFHSKAPPGISIRDYLERIVKYASIEKACLVILLIYIDRVTERDPSFKISSLTVHRFMIIGITCASKALCDAYLSNTLYARVGGLPTRELNVLEIEFLFLIDWQLAVSLDTLHQYYQSLVNSELSVDVPHLAFSKLSLMDKPMRAGQDAPATMEGRLYDNALRMTS